MEHHLVLRIKQMMSKPRMKVPGHRIPRPKPGSRRRSRGATASRATLAPGARRCRAKFLEYFPKGFQDETYRDLERDYKWNAHLRWEELLDQTAFHRLFETGKEETIAANAVAIESRTNLLFSFEKMALRDAVRTPSGARAFAHGLYEFLHGSGDPAARFGAWCAVVAALPRRQTRVLTWPVATVFGFLAQPRLHFFLKPNVTRRAFEVYGLPFHYQSRPNAESYAALLALARKVKRDLASLKPRDMIDIQSFLWIQGSDEYPD
jgi:hypothetical protein